MCSRVSWGPRGRSHDPRGQEERFWMDGASGKGAVGGPGLGVER